MQTITVIIRDNFDENGINYPDPLIYTVEVNNPQDYAEVHTAALDARVNELECDTDEAESVDIDVLLALAGDLTPIADWRE